MIGVGHLVQEMYRDLRHGPSQDTSFFFRGLSQFPKKEDSQRMQQRHSERYWKTSKADAKE